MTIRDKKNSKLGLRRGRSGLSCHEKIWSTLADQNVVMERKPQSSSKQPQFQMMFRISSGHENILF